MPIESFVDSPVQPPADYDCPICYENNRRFVVHPSGPQHPICFDCAKKALEQSLSCPCCRVQISNNLSSRSEKIVNLTKLIYEGSAISLQSIAGDLVFGVAAAAAIAGLQFWGMGGTQNAMTILGWGCVGSVLTGFVGLKGPTAGAEARIAPLAVGGFAGGVFLGAMSFYSWLNSYSTLFQVAGVLPLLHSAGKQSFAISSTVGTAVTALALTAIHALGKKLAITAASIAGASGAMANIRKAPYAITAIAATSGFTAGKLIANSFSKRGQIVSEMIGGILGALFASTASTLLDRGYRSVKNLYASHDN